MHVRIPPFNRARSSDPDDINFAVLTLRSSIVRSRKRKLRELFAVATTTDGVPKHSLANPDVPPLTPTEHDFLQQCDILQYGPAPDLFRSVSAFIRLRIIDLIVIIWPWTNMFCAGVTNSASSQFRRVHLSASISPLNPRTGRRPCWQITRSTLRH